MKKLALTLTLTVACFAANAQGLIRFINDASHLVYYTTDTSKLLAGDTAGGATVNGLTAAGASLSVDLWSGTAADALTKATTVALQNATPGEWTGVTVSGFGVGQRLFFQVQAYDSSAGSYAAAVASNGKYYGESIIFQTTASTSVSPNSIVNAGGLALSTWTAGTQAVSGSLAGGTGAIALQANVPEPTSLALLGLGAAGMMIFRRRK